MKKISNILPADLPAQTEQFKTRSEESTTQIQFKHSKETFRKVWGLMKVAGHIGDKETTEGALYKLWRTSMAELTDDDLERGVKLGVKHPGYCNMGQFIAYCDPGEKAPYHRPYNPNQIENQRGSMTKEQRKAAMAKLREEVGI